MTISCSTTKKRFIFYDQKTSFFFFVSEFVFFKSLLTDFFSSSKLISEAFESKTREDFYDYLISLLAVNERCWCNHDKLFSNYHTGERVQIRMALVCSGLL